VVQVVEPSKHKAQSSNPSIIPLSPQKRKKWEKKHSVRPWKKCEVTHGLKAWVWSESPRLEPPPDLLAPITTGSVFSSVRFILAWEVWDGTLNYSGHIFNLLHKGKCN
jgi:hypothetical protein